MFEKLANIFRIPDLRKRILFTLAMLAVYRLGGHIPTPGINADKLSQFFEQNAGSFLGFVDMFSGGQSAAPDDFRAGDHALHHGVDHLAIADGCVRAIGQAAEGRRTRPQEDHPVDPLLYRRSQPLQSLGIAISLQRGEFVLDPGSGLS